MNMQNSKNYVSILQYISLCNITCMPYAHAIVIRDAPDTCENIQNSTCGHELLACGERERARERASVRKERKASGDVLQSVASS